MVCNCNKLFHKSSTTFVCICVSIGCINFSFKKNVEEFYMEVLHGRISIEFEDTFRELYKVQ